MDSIIWEANIPIIWKVAENSMWNEILDSTLLLKDECICWCDCGDISKNDFADYEGLLSVLSNYVGAL